MELVVRKTDLLRELQLFQGIVERKNTIPILANVLLEANGSEVKMLATDLEVGLRSKCPATVSKSGSLTLPAKKLYEIVKALPETDVRIEEDKGGVKVAADRFDSRMQTLPREDFPSLPEASGTMNATLPREALRQMISKTQFAITGEDTRYFLNGALFLLRPESLGLVSTDGHRLAHITVSRDTSQDDPNKKSAKTAKVDGDEVRVILPRKTLLELGRLLAEGGDGDIQYERGENHLFFGVGERLLISRMIDGQFPAFERVIPKNNDKHVEFDRDRLTSAVKRVALLSNERSRAVKFQIDKGQGRDCLEQSGVRRGEGNPDGGLRGGARHHLLQRAVCARLPCRRRNRHGVARLQGRDEPGGPQAGRRRGLRLHVRDHANENLKSGNLEIWKSKFPSSTFPHFQIFTFPNSE